MIPSAFSDHYGEEHDSGVSVIVATDKTTYDIGDTIFIAGFTEGRSSDPYVELSIYQGEGKERYDFSRTFYDSVRVWVEEVKVPYSGQFIVSVNINSSWN